MASSDARIPTTIRQQDGRTLAIEWADRTWSLIDVRALRLACGCAHCVDEWSGAALLAPDSVPDDVRPVAIRAVGRYAIQISWSDGHDTGIYPFERLRSLSDRGLLVATGVSRESDVSGGAPS
jgi:ATP-binding protein involved in chromosome partitioning